VRAAFGRPFASLRRRLFALSLDGSYPA